MCKMENKTGFGSYKFAEDNKMVTESLDIITGRVVKYMITKGVSLSTAESCTGGLIAEKITGVSGASAIYLGGVVSYSEQVKQDLLGVRRETLDRCTVYSAEVASEMSAGAMRATGSDAAIGVTGLAGPLGGTAEQPVGTVFVSVRVKDSEVVKDLRLYEEYDKMDREFIRLKTAQRALEMLFVLLEGESEDK